MALAVPSASDRARCQARYPRSAAPATTRRPTTMATRAPGERRGGGGGGAPASERSSAVAVARAGRDAPNSSGGSYPEPSSTASAGSGATGSRSFESCLGIVPAVYRRKNGDARSGTPTGRAERSVGAVGLGLQLALVLAGHAGEHVVDRGEPHDLAPGDPPGLLDDPGQRPVLPVGLDLDLVQHVLGEVE